MSLTAIGVGRVGSGGFNALVALRAKQGELQALEALTSSDQVLPIQPLLGFDPHGASPATQLAHVEKAARLLHPLGRQIMIDASTVATNAGYGRAGALGEVVDRLSGPADILDMDYPVPFIPVVRGGSAEQTVIQIRRISEEVGAGVALRIRPAERSRISRVLELLQVDPPSLDLIVDLEHVTDVRPELIEAVLGIAHGVQDGGQIRSISLLAGSVPKTLDRTAVWRQPRYEELIWREVVAQGGQQVKFGDYGPVHAHSSRGFPSKHVNLKYTSSTGWLYSRERLPNEDVGPEGGRTNTVRLVCHHIVNDDDFAGASFSWGDRQMVDAVGGSGAGLRSRSYPIALATSHHLAYLATMGVIAA